MARKASLSEDTLLRMLVAAIADTIAKLAILRTAGNYQQALEIIDHNLEELLGLKADILRQLDDQKIVEMLTTNDFLDVGRLYHVAELFRQEGEIYKAQGQADLTRISQNRAINLFLEVGFAVNNDFLEADDRIDELFDDLGTELSEDTLFSVFDYYEQVGAFDRAETAINQMLEITRNNPDILAEKRAFYSRLIEESDEELTAGGLTRAEIERKLPI
jgi:tetratricopeptide (TPR) repeat protein